MRTRTMRRNLVKMLLEQKGDMTWREFSKRYYPMIPAGTLCAIVRSRGEYIPARDDFRAALGLELLPCPTCHRKPNQPTRGVTINQLLQLPIDQQPAEILMLAFTSRESI